MQGNDQPDPGKHRQSRASVRFTCLGRSLRATSARLRPPPVCQARTRETGRRSGRAQGGCTEGVPGPACPPETGRSSSHGHFTHRSPVRQHVQPRPFPRRGRHCPRFSWLLLLPPSSLPPPCPTRCHERERQRERQGPTTGADRAAATHTVGGRRLLGLACATEIYTGSLPTGLELSSDVRQHFLTRTPHGHRLLAPEQWAPSITYCPAGRPSLTSPGVHQEKAQQADPNGRGDGVAVAARAPWPPSTAGLRVPPCGRPTSQGPLDLSSSWRAVPMSRETPHQLHLRWARPAEPNTVPAGRL